MNWNLNIGTLQGKWGQWKGSVKAFVGQALGDNGIKTDGEAEVTRGKILEAKSRPISASQRASLTRRFT